jgi:regulator of replication initiation timing
MTEAIVKEGFALAEKEQKEKQVDEVKKIVSKTLEKLEEVKKDIRELNEERKILEMDIEDLKEGKIDRIVERQEKDPKAKQISVVVILKEKEVIREVSPWYWPYRVIWPAPVYPTIPVYTSGIASFENTAGESYSIQAQSIGQNFIGYCSTINCSVAKEATIGTYDVNGHPVHLR